MVEMLLGLIFSWSSEYTPLKWVVTGYKHDMHGIFMIHTVMCVRMYVLTICVEESGSVEQRY